MGIEKIALICIAKNEDNYIQEWIDYNKKLGFDDIIIYQNNWRCPINEPNVIKVEFDGETKQVEAYNHFIQNYKNQYSWVAFFDVDEFLVLKKHSNIKEFIADHANAEAIAINWVLFGNNGHETVNDDYSVVNRFTMSQDGCNPHVKCILNLSVNNVRMGVHAPANCNWVDADGNVGSGPMNDKGTKNIAQLNHYFCKTPQEFREKCARGRADTPATQKRSFEVDYAAHNANTVEDLAAYNFFKN